MQHLKRFGVVGAGIMGGGIAQKMAQEDLHVVLVDINQEMIDKGLSTIRQTLEKGVERKILKSEDVDRILSRIKGTTDYEHLSEADLVVEAVFEDKEVKSKVFQTLDHVCPHETILATNTSSFYVGELAQKVSFPERFIGLHYFYHPAMNRLLEIIPHENTSSKTLEDSLSAAKLHAKVPIIVKDFPGFAVNRFFVPFLNEAARLFEEKTANIPTIEEAAKGAFSIPMGPFELMNVTGIPIAVHSSKNLGKELGPFYSTAPILEEQMNTGENWDLSGEVDLSRIEEAKERLLGVCLGVSATLLEEEVASKEDIDRGAKIGLRWRQGPFEIMNSLGIAQTYSVVKSISEKYPDFSMPPVLEEQKKKNQPFYFRFVENNLRNGIGLITINRPEAMNALNEAVVSQLTDNFSKAEQDAKINTVAIQGSGKGFIGGADIKFFIDRIRENNIDEIVDFTSRGHDVLLGLEAASKPTIAILDGASLGGGSELALACQVILATAKGSLAFPETGIGIYPGLGGMLRLAQRVGKELAKYFIFTGTTMTAEEAKELGLVHKVVAFSEIDTVLREISPDNLPNKQNSIALPQKYKALSELFASENVDYLLRGEIPPGADTDLAKKILKKLSSKSPVAMRFANRIIDEQANKPVREAINIELNLLPQVFSTADAWEGLNSVMEGRRPNFKGE